DPVPADYDGDGLTDPATVERATGHWAARLSMTGTTLDVTGWSASSDTLVSSAIAVIVGDAARGGDGDADGRADMTVYNPSSGQWRTLTSQSDYTASIAT